MAPRGRAVADVQLLVASAVTGVAGASFILISGRAIGLDAFAPMAQLWTIWSIAAATLLFAYQQWAIRLDVGRSIGFLDAIRGGPMALALGAAGGTGLVTLVARDSLFHSQSLFWPLAAGVVVLGTVLSGTVRGVLAAAGRHRLLAVVIAADNLVRVAIGVVLVLVGAAVEWYGLALVGSYLVLVVGWSPVPARVHQPRADNTTGSTKTGTATLGSAVIAGFLSHVALAGPPILVGFNGGAAGTVSTLFLVLTAIRLPHLLLQAGTPRAGVVFQDLVTAGRRDRLDRARLAIVGGTITLALAGLGTGMLLGDLVIGTLFDIRGQVEAMTYGAMVAAGVLSVGATFASIQLVAEGRNRLLVSCWLLPLAVVVAAAVAADVTTLGSTAAGLVALHLVVLIALTAAPGAGRRRQRSGGPSESKRSATRW